MVGLRAGRSEKSEGIDVEPMYLIGMVVASVGLMVYGFMPKRADEKEAMLRRMSGRKNTDVKREAAAAAKPQESVVRRFLESVAPIAIKPVMPKNDEEMSNLRVKLANAGFRKESTPTIFLASKTVLGIVFAVVSFGFAWTTGKPPAELFGLTAFVGGMGFMLPNMWLWAARRQRAEKIMNGLPDSLDLMVVSVEAGLALDSALQQVGDEMKITHPELSEEFTIATLEGQMGIPRHEALANLATRTGVPQMKSFVAIVTQAEKFGTSIARALRTQADTLRKKRQQRAEERAQATTVKLLAPLILFIFPSIFVVLAGPAALKLIKTMNSGAF